MNITDAIRVAKAPTLYSTVELGDAINALCSQALGAGPIARQRRSMAHALIVERLNRRKQGEHHHMNAHSLPSAQALDLVCDIAARWGENAEEGFAERVTDETTDEQCAALAERSQVELDEVIEVRNLWRSIATLQAIINQRGCEDFDPAVSNGKLTSLMDIIVFG